MNLRLIRLYCEAVCQKASEMGYKLILTPLGHVWMDKDGKQIGNHYHTNDNRDALHAACMFLDQEKLKLEPVEIK
jgi:hypothetical protein